MKYCLQVRKIVLTYFILLAAILKVTASPVYPMDTLEHTAKQFIMAAFVEGRPAKEIAEKYMYFRPVENFGFKKRIAILKKHIRKLKREKPELGNVSNLSFVRYSNYNKEKPPFREEAKKETVVVLSDDNPLLYVYIKDGNVMSFDYIAKGELAFFVVY